MSKLEKLWKKLPLAWREEIKSFLHTFAAAFIIAVLAQYKSGVVPMESDAFWAFATAVLRSAGKAGFNAAVAQLSAWINRK